LSQNNHPTSFGSDRRLPVAVIEQILQKLAVQGTLTVSELLEEFASDSTSTQFLLCRTITYLLKFDVLALS
jgi:hypothetical protein